MAEPTPATCPPLSPELSAQTKRLLATITAIGEQVGMSIYGVSAADFDSLPLNVQHCIAALTVLAMKSAEDTIVRAHRRAHAEQGRRN